MSNNMLPKLLYSFDEAASVLGGLSTFTLRNWASKGKLKTVKVGDRRMIQAETLHQIVENGLQVN
jgi:excisionase family DNA binding protein